MDSLMLQQIIFLIIVVGLFLLALRVGFVLLLWALLGFLVGVAYNYFLAPLLGTHLIPTHNLWVLVLVGAAAWLVFFRH